MHILWCLRRRWAVSEGPAGAAHGRVLEETAFPTALPTISIFLHLGLCQHEMLNGILYPFHSLLGGALTGIFPPHMFLSHLHFAYYMLLLKRSRGAGVGFFPLPAKELKCRKESVAGGLGES